MDRDTLLELIPAYAINALDVSEREQVEALLENDAEARQLLDEYRQSTDALLLNIPLRHAPPHLTDDLRARLQADKSNPLKSIRTMPEDDKPTQKRPARPHWRTFLPLVAALMLMVVGVVAVLLSTPSVDTSRTLYENLASDEGTRRLALNPAIDDAISGELLISSDGSQAVIRVTRLPELDPDQVFQLWLIGEDVQSGGLYRFTDPAANNYITIPLGASAGAYEAFGVSIEPAGGSPLGNAPSGPRVFNVLL